MNIFNSRFPASLITRVTTAFIGLTILSGLAVADEVEVIRSHAFSMDGPIKYPADFTHWDYVNPNAPKGGTLTQGVQGTFDNFNRFAQRGSSPAGIEALHDDLMVGNLDELQVVYGLVAEQIEYPTDYSWVKFHLNPNARFYDGTPIQAEDVVFTFNKFYEQGVPQFKTLFKGATARALSTSTVEFKLPQPQKNLIFNLASLTVFPKHVYKDIDLSEPLKVPPVSSGSFTVSDYKMGQYIVYKRNKDYWARNHPTQIGSNNFDFYRYEYYLDETVLFEAFKKGEYDIRTENISKNWATQYIGEPFDKKAIIKEEIPHQIPAGNQCYVFNITRDQFKNIYVREAIGLLFDFEWTNKAMFYGAYTRNENYFINSKYASSGLPAGRELEILKSLKGELPAAMFTQPFSAPTTDGTGNIRPQMRKAMALFKQAGYRLDSGKLVDKSGKQLSFEVLFFTPSSERVAIPFKKNLARVGVDMKIRVVSDASQYINRLRERDYDMTVRNLGGYPTVAGLKQEWHSDYYDSTYNGVGVKDKNIDFLVEQIEKSQGDEEEFVAYVHALDRYLLWQHFSIPQWHFSKHRVAYWNKFSRPEVIPKYGLGVENWWLDTKKDEALKQVKN